MSRRIGLPLAAAALATPVLISGCGASESSGLDAQAQASATPTRQTVSQYEGLPSPMSPECQRVAIGQTFAPGHHGNRFVTDLSSVSTLAQKTLADPASAKTAQASLCDAQRSLAPELQFNLGATSNPAAHASPQDLAFAVQVWEQTRQALAADDAAHPPQGVFGPKGNPTPRPAPGLPRIEASQDMGALLTPRSVSGRDVGVAVPLSGELTWLFGDTLLTRKTQDTRQNIRSSTAARGPMGPFTQESLKLTDSESSPHFNPNLLDGNGTPHELIPFSPSEAQFNFKEKHPERWAHWVTGALATQNDGAETGVVYYQKLQTRGEQMLSPSGTFTSTLNGSATVANADELPLFPDGADSYYPVRVYDPATRYQYFIAARQNGVRFEYFVARAPVSDVRNASSFEYWSGKDTWVKGDQHAAQKPIDMKVAGNTASISWNPYLKKFLLVSAAMDVLEVRVSDSIVGNWSEPLRVDRGLLPADQDAPFGLYAGMEHVELSTRGGKDIYATYFQPKDPFSGNLRTVKISFK